LTLSPLLSPFVNQMNTEHGTSGISLHDFNDIQGHRLKMIVERPASAVEGGARRYPHVTNPRNVRARKNELIVTIVTTVTEEEVWS